MTQDEAQQMRIEVEVLDELITEALGKNFMLLRRYTSKLREYTGYIRNGGVMPLRVNKAEIDELREIYRCQYLAAMEHIDKVEARKETM